MLALAATFALVPYIRGLVMDEKKDMVRFLVEEASTILTTYQKQAKAGILTQEDARKRAAADIRQLRYNGKEYFFISDLNNRLIAHPLRPDNEGKDMSSFKDADGKFMYQDFTKAALSDKGAGLSVIARSSQRRASRCRSSATPSFSNRGVGWWGPVSTSMAWTRICGMCSSASGRAFW